MNKSESKYFHTALKFDQALLSLLEKKPFEYITISEICKKAEVNRSTFYLHYENTRELLNETTQYVLRGFFDYFPVEGKSLSEKFRNADLQELVFINKRYLHPYLSYVRDHQRLFVAAMSQPAAFQFDAAFRKLFDAVFDPVLERFQYPESGRKYAMMFYLNGITAILMEWIREGCVKNIDEIMVIIHQCIFGAWDRAGIERILENNDLQGKQDAEA